MKDNRNVQIGKLFDTTLHTQNSLKQADDVQLEVGELVTYEGKPVTAATDKAWGIVGNVGSQSFNGGKYKHHGEYAPVFSAGRVGVDCDSAVAGDKCFYTFATKKYGNSGDIEVGTYVTSGDGPNAVQINIKGA